MEPDTPFQDKMRHAADSALLMLVARWSMVVILPVSGFIGLTLWNKLDKTAETTARLEEKVSNLISQQIPSMQIGFNSRFDAQAERLTAHDYRINRLEDWRNNMPQKAMP